MLKELDLTNVLVLDIETVSGTKSYEDLSPTMQYLWGIKSEQIQRSKSEEQKLSPEASFTELAGIYCEFGKIVCISVGTFRYDKDTNLLKFYVYSYYDHDERKLLSDFAHLLNTKYNNPNKHFLCGHNIREFDIPYICRRMVVNQMELPTLLDIGGKKPWDTKYMLDTLELWKFGDYKSPTSLKLLCGIFGIPTPKDDIDGSQVGITYWQQDDLERIQVYCRKDVVATAQVLLKFKLMPLLDNDTQVVLLDKK